MSNTHDDTVKPFALEDVCGKASVLVDRTECGGVVEPRVPGESHSARTFSSAGQGTASMFEQKSSYEVWAEL